MSLYNNLEKGKKYYSLAHYQYIPVYTKDIYRDWHNDRYFTQCYYNLQEKHDCGGISDKEWQIILNKGGIKNDTCRIA